MSTYLYSDRRRSFAEDLDTKRWHIEQRWKRFEFWNIAEYSARPRQLVSEETRRNVLEIAAGIGFVLVTAAIIFLLLLGLSRWLQA